MNYQHHLGSLVLLALITTCTAYSQPRLSIIGGDTVTWGKVGAGKLRRTVQITNIGSDTLRITKVEPSCGCTTAPLDRTILGSGDTAEIHITIGVAGSGMEHKQVVIQSNDATRPTRQLHLLADVQQDIVAIPLSFPINRNGAVGESYRAEVEIVNRSERVIEVLEPYVADTLENAVVKFFLKLPARLGPQEKLRLGVEITPTKAGLHRIDVAIPVSGEYTSRLMVPAFFVVRDGAMISTSTGK